MASLLKPSQPDRLLQLQKVQIVNTLLRVSDLLAVQGLAPNQTSLCLHAFFPFFQFRRKTHKVFSCSLVGWWEIMTRLARRNIQSLLKTSDLFIYFFTLLPKRNCKCSKQDFFVLLKHLGEPFWIKLNVEIWRGSFFFIFPNQRIPSSLVWLSVLQMQRVFSLKLQPSFIAWEKKKKKGRNCAHQFKFCFASGDRWVVFLW